MTSRRWPLLMVALIVLGGGSHAQGQAPGEQPRLRSGVELVVVDVTVLGLDGAPITTLGPADFTLTVDGKPRRVGIVQRVGATGAETTPTVPPAPAAVAPGPRSFVLVIDREHIPNGEGQDMLAAAARFVDSLAPDDRVALWTTTQLDSSLDFSEPRESIARRIGLAVGTYRPPAGPWNVTLREGLDADARAFGGTFTWVYTDGSTEQFPLSLKPIIERECYQQLDACPKQVQNQATQIAREARDLADGALANLLSLLNAITSLDGPKHIVLVTGGPVMTVENASTVQAIAAQAALARATVHALQVFDPGYQARTDQMRATAERMDQTESAAYALASVTGGLAVTPVAGEAAFSRLSREISVNYLLAFEIEATDRDGRAHAIDVSVRDRGWGSTVRARKTFRIDERATAGAAIAHVAPPPAQPTEATAARAEPAPGAPAAAKPAGTAEAPPVAASSAARPIDPAVDRVVRQMADYVAGYGPQASAIVGVEDYTQQVWVEGRYARPRNLVAEFAIVKAGDGVGWAGFRDVVEVDGKDVADRRDRLLELLTGPAGGESELRRLSDESARYNVGPVIRNFNVPTTALFFFHPDLVDRFSFQRKGTKTIAGVLTWELDFQETQRPTLVMTRDGRDVPCEGTVWVEPENGTVVRTKLKLRNFADQAFMSGTDQGPTAHVRVGEFSTVPTQSQTTTSQPPPQQGPPAPPTTTPPTGQPPPSTGGTSTSSSGTVTRTTTGVDPGRPVRRPSPDPDWLEGTGIVELESLVDIDVTYRRDKTSGLWLPDRMSEIYEGPIPRGTKPPVLGRTVGTARYSDFKRFETSVRIVIPK